MLHAKLAVVDRTWSTVGTFNMNPTAVSLTNEVNVFVHDPTFTARLAHLFEADRRSCRPVTRESVARRPFFSRIVDQLAADAVALLDRIGGIAPR